MNSLTEFLKKSRDFVDKSKFPKDVRIHVVLGNESCDLDSMVSAIALSYFHHYSGTETTSKRIIIPVLNVPPEEFLIRTENCYLCNKLGLQQNFLVFKSELNLKRLKEKGLLTISLVDHHMLACDDQFLAECVIEIYDHRPVDPNAIWDKDKVKVVIEQVGSCATLITREIYKIDNLLPHTLAVLLYYVIVFDTIAFCPEAKKFNEQDVEISRKLAKQFNITETPKEIFDKLWAARIDVSNLTAYQLLYKDLKFVNGIPIAVVPTLVKDFLKLPNVIEDVSKFCEDKQTPVVILLGLHVEGKKVDRDIAIYALDKKLMSRIIQNLQNTRECDLELQEIPLDLINIKYFIQKNVRLTRKHILPLIKNLKL